MQKEIILAGNWLDNVLNTINKTAETITGAASTAKQITDTVATAKQQITYSVNSGSVSVPATQTSAVQQTQSNPSTGINNTFVIASIAGLMILAATFFLTGKKRR